MSGTDRAGRYLLVVYHPEDEYDYTLLPYTTLDVARSDLRRLSHRIRNGVDGEWEAQESRFIVPETDRIMGATIYEAKVGFDDRRGEIR